MRIITGLRLGAAAAGAVGALAVLPVGANAAFEPAFGTQCQGAGSIAGRGASFQRQAQLAWGSQLLAPDPAAAETNGFGYATTANGGCSVFQVGATNGQKVTFEPRGSGDGRGAMGATTSVAASGSPGIRNTAIQFGAADEPPTTPQLAAANNGPDLTAGTADDATLLTVPVAQSSVATVVKLPAGCTVPYAERKLSRAALEGAFAADEPYNTWGEVLPAIVGADAGGTATCAATPVKRVVRLDSSGTTFAFKNYLRDIDSTDFPTSLGNQAWPDDAGASAVARGAANGAGALMAALSARSDGGIGYADLATARANGYDHSVTNGVPNADDSSFWVNVARADGAFQSPALSDNAGTANTGSNCRNVTYSDPAANGLPAVTASWANVSGVASAADYPLCTLTYQLVWQDLQKANGGLAPGVDPYTQAQARTVKDQLGYVLNVGGGQAALAPNGYQALPSIDSGSGAALSGSVLAVAQAAQKSLTWNGAPVVVPPPGDGGGTPPVDGGNQNPPVVTPPVVTPPVVTPPVQTPPKPAPVAKPTLRVSKATGGKGRSIALTVSPSAAGKVSVSVTTGSGKKKVTVGKASGSPKKAGALKLTIKPSAKGKKALKVGKSVKLTFKVTFTRADGSKVTATKSIKVKIKR